MMPTARSTRIPLAIIVLGVIGLAVAMPNMVVRLRGRDLPLVWFDQPVTDEQFKWMGLPILVTTVRGEGTGLAYRANGADGYPTVSEVSYDSTEPPARVEVFWRGQTFTQPFVGQHIDWRLPVLLKHEDWLKVVLMAEGAQSRADLEVGLAEGRLHPRLIIAIRLPPENYDPESWGRVRRKDWRYRFVELLPPQSGPQVFREFTGTYAELDALGDPDQRRADGREDDLWMYHAMLQVTPPQLYRARNKPIEGAMRALGWTWPLAGCSLTLIALGAGLRSASRVPRPLPQHSQPDQPLS